MSETKKDSPGLWLLHFDCRCFRLRYIFSFLLFVKDKKDEEVDQEQKTVEPKATALMKQTNTGTVYYLDGYACEKREHTCRNIPIVCCSGASRYSEDSSSTGTEQNVKKVSPPENNGLVTSRAV